jgi:membrane protease YdiL (CAAX protease family)
MRAKTTGVLSPIPAIIGEGAQFSLALLITAVFLAIEHRPWRDIAMPWREAFGTRFWRGVLWGLGALSALVILIYAAHGLAFAGFATVGTPALQSGFLWAAVFVLVGGFEEVLFRGYILQTLTRGIGFWPAVVILSASSAQCTFRTCMKNGLER